MTAGVDADVVVVGAGFAGLAAARTLTGSGVEPIVLEARDRVGGRTLNAEVGDGQVVEAGGQWVGPTQDRIAALAHAVGVETFPTHTAGENVLLLGGRRRRYRGTIPRLGPPTLIDIGLGLRRLNRVARSIDIERPWDSPGAARLDAISLAEWVKRTMRTRNAQRLLRIACRTTWGAEPEELSMLHAAFYIASAGSFEMLTDTEGGAQQDRFVGGSAEVAERVAAELGERVALGAPVTSIAQDASGITVAASGRELRARRAIVTVPPALRTRIEFDPPLPAAQLGLAQRMAMGWLIKTTVVYPEPFWRGDGLSGEALSETGPVTITFDNTPPGDTPGVLVGFVGGADARAFARLGSSERREAVLGGLEALFGPRARGAERYLEQDWPSERWTAGGPVANFATGGWTAAGAALREPVGRVSWAGAETATRWCGYLDGAVSSGERAAAETIERLDARPGRGPG